MSFFQRPCGCRRRFLVCLRRRCAAPLTSSADRRMAIRRGCWRPQGLAVALIGVPIAAVATGPRLAMCSCRTLSCAVLHANPGEPQGAASAPTPGRRGRLRQAGDRKSARRQSWISEPRGHGATRLTAGHDAATAAPCIAGQRPLTVAAEQVERPQPRKRLLRQSCQPHAVC